MKKVTPEQQSQITDKMIAFITNGYKNYLFDAPDFMKGPLQQSINNILAIVSPDDADLFLAELIYVTKTYGDEIVHHILSYNPKCGESKKTYLLNYVHDKVVLTKEGKGFTAFMANGVLAHFHTGLNAPTQKFVNWLRKAIPLPPKFQEQIALIDSLEERLKVSLEFSLVFYILYYKKDMLPQKLKTLISNPKLDAKDISPEIADFVCIETTNLIIDLNKNPKAKLNLTYEMIKCSLYENMKEEVCSKATKLN